MIRKPFYFLLLMVLILSGGCGGSSSTSAVDRTLRSMRLEQKVGQLFLIRPDQLDTTLTAEEIHDYKASGDREMTDVMKTTLRQYPAGGFVIFKKNITDPEQLERFMGSLKDSCREASGLAPVMAVDEEGGLVARIANHGSFDVQKFESMEAIGSTGDPEKAKEAGSVIGEYLNRYGFTLNFAPVADVNTNPENTVIGKRAFGSDPNLVSKMVGAYLDGLHEHGVAGSIKHFPGHGDTKDDTHSGYVSVSKTWDELLKAELIPFRENFGRTDSVMVAHITLSNITSDGLPATLSHELITGKLRDELGYDGLVITDSLAMGAIVKAYGSGEAAVMALEAGNDILLMPWDYGEAFEGVLKAIQEGRISEARLDESVRRILALKMKR
ncbi:MAG: glycoside hydrolase family 3 protein [Fretibacterium sp.]|nr:glycoside hydrolase family 3 protein [Fretibacterium sp.]